MAMYLENDVRVNTQKSKSSHSAYLPKAHKSNWKHWEHTVRFLDLKPFLYKAHLLDFAEVDETFIAYCLGTPAGGLEWEYDPCRNREGISICQSIRAKGRYIHEGRSDGQTYAAYGIWHYQQQRAFILTCRKGDSLDRGLEALKERIGPLSAYDTHLSANATEVEDGYRYQVRHVEGNPLFDPYVADEYWCRYCAESLRWNKDRVVNSIKNWLKRNGVEDAVEVADHVAWYSSCDPGDR